MPRTALIYEAWMGVPKTVFKHFYYDYETAYLPFGGLDALSLSPHDG